MSKCPLTSIEIGEFSCPNRNCMWHSKLKEITNNCVAIHEPQYEHLTVDELAEFKGLKRVSEYVTRAKRHMLVIILFSEYVEYVRDNISSCCAKKIRKRKYRAILRIKELSITENMLPFVAHSSNYKKFCVARKPVLNVELKEIFSTLGDLNEFIIS